VHLNKQASACQAHYRITLVPSEEMARSAKNRVQRGQLRIIGGQWRGRKFAFIPVEGLRPTTDRVRETLFNWLAPDVSGASCLDLFAGSGALGLEALSRGARSCDFVDTSGTAIAQIENHLEVADAKERARCQATRAAQFLAAAERSYDIVFIDPPFGQDLVERCCAALEEQRLLAPGALIYVETAASEPCPAVPANWKRHREKTAGGVAYRLYARACT